MHLRHDIDPDIVMCLLEHLREKPSADIVQVVADWKLMAYRIEKTVPKVRAALAELIREGLVKKSFIDNETVYALDPTRGSEIRELMSSLHYDTHSEAKRPGGRHA